MNEKTLVSSEQAGWGDVHLTHHQEQVVQTAQKDCHSQVSDHAREQEVLNSFILKSVSPSGSSQSWEILILTNSPIVTPNSTSTKRALKNLPTSLLSPTIQYVIVPHKIVGTIRRGMMSKRRREMIHVVGV